MTGRRSRVPRAVSVGLVAMVISGCAKAGPVLGQGKEPGSPPAVTVYALSKGKGVPPATRETFKKARALLQDLHREDRVVRIDETRIGLEGEVRLCAEFTDERTARETIERLRESSRDVELLNVVEEPCRKAE
ncbi:MAG: hypothetical protein ACRDLY_12310 [Thermoleophilaceae bacterium]